MARRETKRAMVARLLAETKHIEEIDRFRNLLASLKNPELTSEEESVIYNKIDSMVGAVITTEEAAELGWL